MSVSLKSGLCSSVAAVAMLVGTGGYFQAHAQTRNFDLKPLNATQAIPEFARQAGVQIMAPADEIEGLNLPGIRGQRDVRQALEQLLKGTNLEIESDDGSVITLRLRARKASLGTVVPAAAEPNTPVIPSSSAAGTAQSPAVDEIIVTGSRVAREGFEAPTPTMVMNVEAITSQAPANIADAVNRLPSLAGSVTPRSNPSAVSADTAGVNNLNLRGLGISRTLVLLDGQRVVGSTIINAVDINEFPEGLIERVDVVTGGASAAYGSDALSGVVNFILDRRFEGVKGELQGGVSTYGDDRQYKVSLTAGSSFANDRGHFLLNLDHSHVDGVQGVPRPWYKGWQVINNPAYTPTNGAPRLISRPEVGLSLATGGALVVSGPLRGLDFTNGGQVRQFNFGPIVSDPMMQGGDWLASEIGSVGDLEARMSRRGLFTRASYEVSDNIEVFAQLSSAFTNTSGVCCEMFELGNVTIRADNAFLPQQVATRMAELGLTSLLVGTTNEELGGIVTRNKRAVKRWVVGANGGFAALGSDWTWDAYFQEGVSRTSTTPGVTINAKKSEAIDAVRGANGAIVCRSTLTNPGNGCVPYNILGVNVNSQAAINYVMGYPMLQQRFSQKVGAATVQGEPFDTWAGPVSIAVGGEYREEKVFAVADTLPQTFAGNYLATNGRYDVVEGFVETIVPLAQNVAWAQSLELNGAVRLTNYSTSGFVATWKAGATYSPVDEVRFRATRSRDIRAPNLNDLFQAGQTNTQTISDPFRGGVTTSILRPAIGNPGLNPEKADTTGLGVVYQPSWISGLNLSFDFYNIDIQGAISSINQQELINRCFAGNTALCSAVERDATGSIFRVTVQPTNFLSQTARGFDIEASYRTSLDAIVNGWDGDLSLRAMGSHVLTLNTDDGIRVHEYAGEYGSSGLSTPTWRWLGVVSYENDPISMSVTGRYVNGGVIDTDWISCVSGCPTSSAVNQTIDNNSTKGAFYLDLSLRHKMYSRDRGDNTDVELFLTVDNVMNRDPAVVPSDRILQFINEGTNGAVFDEIGRMFRAGVRFRH